MWYDSHLVSLFEAGRAAALHNASTLDGVPTSECPLLEEGISRSDLSYLVPGQVPRGMTGKALLHRTRPRTQWISWVRLNHPRRVLRRPCPEPTTTTSLPVEFLFGKPKTGVVCGYYLALSGSETVMKYVTILRHPQGGSSLVFNSTVAMIIRHSPVEPPR